MLGMRGSDNTTKSTDIKRIVSAGDPTPPCFAK